MPITGSAANKEVAELGRRLRAHRAMKAAIVQGAAPELPELAGEQLQARKTPSGRRWAKLVRPRRGASLAPVQDGLTVEVTDTAIRVTNPSTGSGYLQYGRRGQEPRPYLPEKDLPKRWKDRLALAGMGGLAWYLGRGLKGLRALQRASAPVAKAARKAAGRGLRRAAGKASRAVKAKVKRARMVLRRKFVRRRRRRG